MRTDPVGTAALPAREAIADYRFTEALGTGDHGTSYLAAAPARLAAGTAAVAVKVLSGAVTQETFRLVAHRLAAFAAVASPYLITLYDVGQQSAELYYSMEYVAQGSLGRPAAPLPRELVLTAVAQASRAAHALHEAGVAHGGIKPANILLRDGGRLADPDLHQALAPGRTIGGHASAAAVEFLDPAVLGGSVAPCRASDVFALGATLHRALTGRGIYGDLPAGDAVAALRIALSREAAASPDLDPAVRPVVAAAVSSDPRARPATALELAERIESLT